MNVKERSRERRAVNQRERHQEREGKGAVKSEASPGGKVEGQLSNHFEHGQRIHY